MQKEHLKLLEQYKQNQKLHEQATKKTVVLEIFLVFIVCGMKAAEKGASLQLNLVATSLVVFLAIWHFWDFKYRWNLEWKKSEIILAGIEEENKVSPPESSFFQDYIKEFSLIGKLAHLAIFDFAFLYFFSVSITQLLKAISPTIVANLLSSTSLRTIIISGALGWIYYLPIRSLTYLKKRLETIE